MHIFIFFFLFFFPNVKTALISLSGKVIIVNYFTFETIFCCTLILFLSLPFWTFAVLLVLLIFVANSNFFPSL